MAEVGSVEVARDPEVRALRAANKRLAQELDIQELDILKKPWSSSASRPVSTYCYIAQRAGQVPVRQLCQTLRVAPAAYYA